MLHLLIKRCSYGGPQAVLTVWCRPLTGQVRSLAIPLSCSTFLFIFFSSNIHVYPETYTKGIISIAVYVATFCNHVLVAADKIILNGTLTGYQA